MDATAIDSAAAAWQRLTDDITTATDDGERSFGAGPTADVHAQLVVADLRSLAARSALGARLLGAIGSGVRRLDAELSVLEQDWAAAQVLLASPAMAAACAGVLEVHQAKCRDAAARTYNAAVARWESLAAAGVGR
ncbi:hypothetical protein [Williamsia sp. CHRR-6]|uniref:hypothetical protein n=1 Tax=Williamsia sp. CHRR-6 TaxID=2835871 RepID=UPI001BD98EDA|nr:hypothetical protein [Williamsia sp. CHRR-6]MBT0566256.1 hypothetical protein [Williamsia sp. CHRR-6]